MEKITYAMIGFGGIAENRIAKEGFGCDKTRFDGHPLAELVGATDMNKARKKAAKALGLKWYKTVDDILSDKKIAAVYIATNNASHAAIAIKALKAGKHVMVEKPMATTPEDAKAMIKLAAAKGLSLTVDHMMVYNAYNQMARKYIEDGKIGLVNDSCFHMEFLYGSTPEEAATWRCSKVKELGGPIGDVASHCLYMAEFMFGSNVYKVQAVYLPKTLAIKAEDGAYIHFELENGQKGSIKVAFSEPRGGLVGTLSNLGYEIYGEEGVLRCYGGLFQLSGTPDEPYGIRLEADLGRKGVKALRPRQTENIYQQIIAKHAKSIIDGTPINAEDGLRNLRACMMMHKSALNGGKPFVVR
ncbi:MAG: Gfo/Idh/MocA family oxidoreductase [Lentisphaeria bacterium]|nr:Gfo/Idh/MocA family oxidoreductase [Lentisphaeria bacterium]